MIELNITKQLYYVTIEKYWRKLFCHFMPFDMVIVVFCCKFCEVPSRDATKRITITETVVVLRKIREQPPNISHRQLAEITGVPRTTLVQILQDFG